MLPKETQIKILKEVLELLIKKEYNDGLCCILGEKITFYLEFSLFSSMIINDYISLFTQENAIKYANGRKGLYWWDFVPYDYENRIVFIKWIISELEKE